MTLQIDTQNRLVLDGHTLNLGIMQFWAGTVIYTLETHNSEYKEHTMPLDRYTTVTPAGLGRLEADIRQLLTTI